MSEIWTTECTECDAGAGKVFTEATKFKPYPDNREDCPHCNKGKMAVSRADWVALKCLDEGRLIVDTENGIIYRTRSASSGKPCTPYHAEINNYGKYDLITLSYEGLQATISVHRVVWFAKHGAIPKGLHINHKDLNKTNNSIFNLEIVTPSENAKHNYNNGRVAERRQLSDRQVVLLRLDALNGMTERQLAQKYKIKLGGVNRIKQGQTYRNVSTPVKLKPAEGV
jgi:hypothetical protein